MNEAGGVGQSWGDHVFPPRPRRPLTKNGVTLLLYASEVAGADHGQAHQSHISAMDLPSI